METDLQSTKIVCDLKFLQLTRTEDLKRDLHKFENALRQGGQNAKFSI